MPAPTASVPRSTSTTSRPVAVDLAGAVVSERRTSVDTRGLEPDEVVDRLVELLARHAGRPGRARRGPGLGGRGRRRAWSTTTAAPSRSRPTSGGRTSPLASLLRARLGDPDYLLEVANEANLAAVAEAIPGDPERRDILVIHGEVGIGGGIVADGRPFAGPARLRRRVRPHGRRPRRQPVRLRSHGVLGDRHRPQPPDRAGRRGRGRPAAIAPTSTSRARSRRSTAAPPPATSGRWPRCARSAAGSASAPRSSPTRSTPG